MIDLTFRYADLEYFLLIFVRITSFIFIAPFFGMSNTPLRVKVGLGLFIAYIVDQSMPHNEVVYNTLFGYAIVVMKEAATGFLVGFGATLCSTIVAFAGYIADMESGLSMASLVDPTTRENTSITGVYYNYAILMMLLVTGMYRFILQALIDTFTLIPINGAIFRIDALMASMIQFMSDYIVIGFRICLPVFAVMLVLNAVLGILAKVSPQLNMFAVGMQMKVLVGLAVLFITAGMLPGAANFIFEQMKKMIVAFVEGMM